MEVPVLLGIGYRRQCPVIGAFTQVIPYAPAPADHAPDKLITNTEIRIHRPGVHSVKNGVVAAFHGRYSRSMHQHLRL